jgi:transcriptional regulator with XRE-family HTH domain
VTADDADPRRPHDPPWRSRTARRSLAPDVAALLAHARWARSWSLLEASRATGVSATHLANLERGRRVPSLAVAEDLIRAYRLPPGFAERLRAVAAPCAGRSSPYRRGWRPRT